MKAGVIARVDVHVPAAAAAVSGGSEATQYVSRTPSTAAHVNYAYLDDDLQEHHDYRMLQQWRGLDSTRPPRPGNDLEDMTSSPQPLYEDCEPHRRRRSYADSEPATLSVISSSRLNAHRDYSRADDDDVDVMQTAAATAAGVYQSVNDTCV